MDLGYQVGRGITFLGSLKLLTRKPGKKQAVSNMHC